MWRFVRWILICFATIWSSSAMANSTWEFKKMPIRWHVVYSTDVNWNGRSLNEVKSIVEKAFQIWQDTGCAPILLRYEKRTTEHARMGDKKNTIDWVKTLPDASDDKAIHGLQAFGRKVLEADIWIKDTQISDEKLVLLLAQQFGYVLGLGTSQDKKSLMYASLQSGASLTKADRDALCAKYPKTVSSCQKQEDCPTGFPCKGGQCSICKKNEDCPKGQACDRGLCFGCKSDFDCDANSYCENATCKPKCKTSEECSPTGHICKAGRCGPCRSTFDCKRSERCVSGRCLRPCQTRSDCPDGLACYEKQCTPCQEDNECGRAYYCQTGKCLPRCKEDKDCPTKGQICRDMKCKNCQSDTDCGDRLKCEAKLCVPRKCELHSDCRSDELCVQKTCAYVPKLGVTCSSKADCGDTRIECVPRRCQKDGDCLSGQSCKDGDCKSANDEKILVCAPLCDAKGSCPKSGSCQAFDSERSYCFFKTLPFPSEPSGEEGSLPTPDAGSGPEKTQPTKKEGCGCSAESDAPEQSSSVLLLLLLCCLLFFRSSRLRAS